LITIIRLGSAQMRMRRGLRLTERKREADAVVNVVNRHEREHESEQKDKEAQGRKEEHEMQGRTRRSRQTSADGVQVQTRLPVDDLLANRSLAISYRPHSSASIQEVRLRGGRTRLACEPTVQIEKRKEKEEECRRRVKTYGASRERERNGCCRHSRLREEKRPGGSRQVKVKMRMKRVEEASAYRGAIGYLGGKARKSTARKEGKMV
jgi:hypothetical protein